MNNNLHTIATFVLAWSAFFSSASQGNAQESWGGLSGTISLSGHTDRPLENVLVWLIPENLDELPIHPRLSLTAENPVEISLLDGKFDTKFALVRAGQKLHIRNNDRKGHHIVPLTLSNESSPNIPPGMTQTYVFRNAEKIPGRLACTIQEEMQIPLFISDHPYMATTDSDGLFQINLIPDGKWKFRFWHPQHGFLKSLESPDLSLDRKATTTIEINGTLRELGCLKLPSPQPSSPKHSQPSD